MSKRKAVELTGGTGDVNPQWLGFTFTQSGNDMATEVSIDMPISPSMVSRAGKALVIELLKVQFIWSLDTTQSPSSPQRWTAIVGTSSTGAGLALSSIQSLSTTIIADQTTSIQAGAGSTVMFAPRSTLYDITDGAGHGVIVASKALFCNINTVNTGVTNRVVFRFLYRYKEVGLTEYLTLAQFQS